nr:hypothetical protein [Tanacetum cinerariifolium]
EQQGLSRTRRREEQREERGTLNGKPWRHV